MFIHNKLVRDKIPQIMQASGKNPKFRVLFDKEYIFMLNKKLNEEVQVLHHSNSVEGLVDIMEIIFALSKTKGISEEELLKIRDEKLEIQGAFHQKIYLETVN